MKMVYQVINYINITPLPLLLVTFIGYGMTEVVILSHITRLSDNTKFTKHFGSCGTLLPGFQAKVCFFNLFTPKKKTKF